jgi:WXG100 family type VII secretion target
VTDGDGLRIETDAVSAAVGEFRSIANELRDGLRQVVTAADEVVDASWRGEAASAFRVEWDEFRESAQSIVEDADAIADLVAYSVKAYVAEDDSSAAVLRSVWVQP